MGKLKRFGVSLEEDLLLKFDAQIRKENYPTRSKAIADLVNSYLLEKSKISARCLVGVVSLVYNHHKRMISENLTEIQHNHHHLIISSQHIHLDHDNCFEIVILKGNGESIENLFNLLKSVKGVKNAHLTVAGDAGDNCDHHRHFHKI